MVLYWLSILEKGINSKVNKNAKQYLKSDNLFNMKNLVKIYGSYVYTIVNNSINGNEDIEEIVSDVFLALWQNREKIQEEADLKPYLIVITKNLIKKKYRDLKKNVSTCDIDDLENVIASQMDISQIVENDEKKQIISNTIKHLQEEEKAIFTLYYYNNKMIKEIASYLKISTTKVKVSLHRIRKKVKKELMKRGYSYGK